MTVHRTSRDGYSFECDACNEMLNTGEAEWSDAVQGLREEGWSAIPTEDEWKHKCPGCRFNPHQQRRRSA